MRFLLKVLLIIPLDPFDYIYEPDPVLARQNAVYLDRRLTFNQLPFTYDSSDDTSYQPNSTTSSSSSQDNSAVTENSQDLEDLLDDANFDFVPDLQ